MITKEQNHADAYLISEKFFSPRRHPDTEYRYARTSSHLCNWILSYSQLRRNARVVALEIASYYSPDSGYSFPTIDQIATKVGLSATSVKRAIQEMKKSGEWLVVNISVGQRQRKTSNRYYPLSPLEGDLLVRSPYKASIENPHENEWQPLRTYKTVAEYQTATSSLQSQYRKLK